MAAMTTNKSKVLVLLSHSHVSELWLPPDQDIPDPFNLKKLPLNVVHSDCGVCHGYHVVLWGRENNKEKDRF